MSVSALGGRGPADESAEFGAGPVEPWDASQVEIDLSANEPTVRAIVLSRDGDPIEFEMTMPVRASSHPHNDVNGSLQ